MIDRKTYHFAVLPGDGIGPEVMAEAVRGLRAVAEADGFFVHVTTHLMGGAALDAVGDPLPDATLAACRVADAVLLGAVGGPKWDGLAGTMRPESGLLRLRKGLGVFANLRPVAVPTTLAGASPLRPSVVAGADLLVVRELTGGIYFGEPQGRDGDRAFNTMTYSASEVERVARVGFEWARRRRAHVTSVDKANVLEVSRLWREVVTRLHRDEYPDVALRHLYVDNAAMQLVRDPRSFDVLLTGNLFGDILSDLAATLPGSLGMLPSASLGGGVGLFEPVHGSAPDIAGTGQANPLAALLSAAMALDTLGEPAAAEALRHGVDAALAEGLRTPDLVGEGSRAATTEEMGAAVARHAVARLSQVSVSEALASEALASEVPA